MRAPSAAPSSRPLRSVSCALADVRPTVVRILSALLALSTLVLLLSLLGLLPAREPGPIRSQKLDLDKAVERARSVRASAATAKPAPELTLARAALCKAPARGARAYRVGLSATRDSLVVWCDGGYQLFALSTAGGIREVERLARFASRSTLSGGAVGGDFDGDGASDLMLGVAPASGVLHEPGAGVYWVRGRSQGGYAPARVIAEAPSVALAEGEFDGAPSSDLVVLTRGDLAAQRPGELWLYAQGALLTRVRVVPVGLDPRGVVLAQRAGGALVAVGLVGTPGALVTVELTKELLAGGQPDRRSVPVRGAQDFLAGLRGQPPLLRDPTDVKAVKLEPELAAPVWVTGANIGPGAALDLDGDGQLDVLGSALHELVLLAEQGARSAQELALGEQVTVRDVLVLRDATGQGRAFALVENAGEPRELSLVSVPSPPWDTALSVSYENVATHDSAALAEVPLE